MSRIADALDRLRRKTTERTDTSPRLSSEFSDPWQLSDTDVQPSDAATAPQPPAVPAPAEPVRASARVSRKSANPIPVVNLDPSLLARWLFLTPDRPRRRVLVCAADDSVDCALAIAEGLATEVKRDVFLVDFSARPSAFEAAFGAFGRPGTSDALQSGEQLAAFAYPTAHKDVHAVPAGSQASQLQTLIRTKAGLDEAVRLLDQAPYAIGSMGGVMPTDDLAAFSTLFDGVVLAGNTWSSTYETRVMADALTAAGLNLLATPLLFNRDH